MANIELKQHRDGRAYYRIRVFRNSDRKYLSENWDVPEGMSFNSQRGRERIEAALNVEIARFKLECDNGNIKTRADIKAEEERAAAEEARMLTVKSYALNRFIPYKEDETEVRTVQYYEGVLRNHVLPFIGKFNMSEITSAQLSALIQKAQRKGLSKSTVRGIHVTLSQLFELAYVTDELIERNPMDRVKRPQMTKGSLKNKKAESLTLEELKNVLSCLKDEPLKWRTLITLMASTGCRVGEIVALRWSSIDFEHNCITIDRSIGYTPQKGIFVTTPKGKTVRTVQVEVNEAMRLLMELKKESKVLTLSGYCFTSADDPTLPMHPHSPARYLQTFAKKYGIKRNLHPHLFRHTYASILIANNADPASVSYLLGHADVSTTMNMYVVSFEDSKRKAAGIFGDVLEKASGNIDDNKSISFMQ